MDPALGVYLAGAILTSATSATSMLRTAALPTADTACIRCRLYRVSIDGTGVGLSLLVNLSVAAVAWPAYAGAAALRRWNFRSCPRRSCGHRG